MKHHYISLVVCALTAIGGFLIVLSSPLVMAETAADYFASQQQITTLVTMAIPPYKW